MDMVDFVVLFEEEFFELFYWGEEVEVLDVVILCIGVLVMYFGIFVVC